MFYLTNAAGTPVTDSFSNTITFTSRYQAEEFGRTYVGHGFTVHAGRS